MPQANITVLSARAGEGDQPRCGLILSSPRPEGHYFEQGPYNSVLVDKNGREMLGLLKLLGLEEDVVSANIENSARRHLLHHGKVQLFPRPQHILRFCPPLLLEPLYGRGKTPDESVYDFVRRRSSRDVADRIADPICRGLFGGASASEVSVRSCFPRLWSNEKRFRSVFVGSILSTFTTYRQRSWLSLDLLDPLLQRVSAGGRCYTLRRGLGSVLDKLEEKLKHPLGTQPAQFNKQVVRIAQQQESRKVELTIAGGQVVAVDAVISTLKPAETASILASSNLDCPLPPSSTPAVSKSSKATATTDAAAAATAGTETATAATTAAAAADTTTATTTAASTPTSWDLSTAETLTEALKSVPHKTLAVVNMTFDKDVLKGKFRGAGFFVGSKEDESIIAMSWDSQMFPTLPGRYRLTVYIPGDIAPTQQLAEEQAVAALRRLLHVDDEPIEVVSTIWDEAVPVYVVGHRELMHRANIARISRLPWLHLAGPGYFGPRSAADEVVDAREVVDGLVRRFARFPKLVERETKEDVERRHGMGFDAN